MKPPPASDGQRPGPFPAVEVHKGDTTSRQLWWQRLWTTKRAVPALGDDFLRRDGLTETPAVWEDGLRADTRPGSFEWWYFDAHLDDGSTAVIVYATKPLNRPHDQLTPIVMLTVTRPDGRRIPSSRVHPPAGFSAARDSCNVCIGPSWVRGDLHRYALHAETQRLAADLTFTGHVPPWRPGAGKCYFDETGARYFAWLPAIPFGYVEGSLTYDGQTRRVTGTGYHDHNWGTVGLRDVLSRWYWGRAHVGDFSLIFAEQVATAEYGFQKLPVFMLARGDRILTGDGRPLTLQVRDLTRHRDRREYPREADFHWQTAEGTVHIALRQPRVVEASSLLIFLPAWKRRLIRLFANPYYFRFDAEMELTVDLPDTRAAERGRALYEVMLLR